MNLQTFCFCQRNLPLKGEKKNERANVLFFSLGPLNESFVKGRTVRDPRAKYQLPRFPRPDSIVSEDLFAVHPVRPVILLKSRYSRVKLDSVNKVNSPPSVALGVVDFIDVITIGVRQNAAPTVRNSSGLPIVLPGMPSISIRGIVTGRESVSSPSRPRVIIHDVALNDSRARLYLSPSKRHRILFSSRE